MINVEDLKEGLIVLATINETPYPISATLLSPTHDGTRWYVEFDSLINDTKIGVIPHEHILRIIQREE